MQKNDEAAVKRMMRRFSMGREAPGFPTVVAKRDGKLIGLLSTRPVTEAIVAGPLIVDLPTRGVVTMRLVEAYDIVLRRAGVKNYLFHVKKGKAWAEQVERALGVAPYTEDGHGNLWFKRDL